MRPANPVDTLVFLCKQYIRQVRFIYVHVRYNLQHGPDLMTSLRRKIGLGFYAFMAGIAAVAVIAYLDLRFLAGRIERGVVIESFLDACLEVRRYEKNYFLYGEER